MNDELSPDTQAIALLTAPLLLRPAARIAPEPPPLTVAEYGQLALCLRGLGRTPADLLADRELLERCDHVVPRERVRRLLDRGFLLAQALERWAGRAIWLMSRADGDYPPNLKAHLGNAAPPLVYGCGDRTLVARGGLALAPGCRWQADTLARVARLIAEAGAALVTPTPVGSLDCHVIAAVPGHLERAALSPLHRAALIAHRLVIVSSCDPLAAPDSAAHAVAPLIAALADATIDDVPSDASVLATLLATARAARSR